MDINCLWQRGESDPIIRQSRESRGREVIKEMELCGRLLHSLLVSNELPFKSTTLLSTKYRSETVFGAEEIFVNNNSVDKSINFERLPVYSM